jgi:hypothetical protein
MPAGSFAGPAEAPTPNGIMLGTTFTALSLVFAELEALVDAWGVTSTLRGNCATTTFLFDEPDGSCCD